MRLIKPYYEIIEQESGLIGMKKHIEKAKRVCYKSEDNITEDSYEKAVQGLIDLKHGAMLEHGTVYLKFTALKIDEPIVLKYARDKYSTISQYPRLLVGHENGNCYVTTNYRVIVENGWLEDLQYLCEPTEYHKKRVTVKFTCDRGVSHEFVRHKNTLCVA